MTNNSITHRNDEKMVKCPAKDCDAEVLSRGLHLHVMRSSGDGHGEQNEVPDNLDLDKAEEVGTKEVKMDYPETREGEQVARMCPYCERPFRGKYGVMIHLGQLAGRKNHPENGPELHDPDDFSIVHVDENENIVEVTDGETSLPATERRQEKMDTPNLDNESIQAYINDLRERGKDEEADRAEEMLF